jgi:hypothetical protein
VLITTFGQSQESIAALRSGWEAVWRRAFERISAMSAETSSAV